MSMTIEILEEALCVESVLSNKLSEIIHNALYIFSLSWSGFRSSIDNVCSSSTNFSIDCFFKTLLGETFINVVAEFSPLNVSSLFWCLVCFTKLCEFLLRNGDLSHVESNSELGSSDES